mgnify:CR=1 FL=1
MFRGGRDLRTGSRGLRQAEDQSRDVVDGVRAGRSLWRSGRRCWRTGLDEAARSDVQEAVSGEPPGAGSPIFPDCVCLAAGPCRRDGARGVRAGTASWRRRLLLRDRHRAKVRVLNAPSPAATASLVIAKRIASELEGRRIERHLLARLGACAPPEACLITLEHAA